MKVSDRLLAEPIGTFWLGIVAGKSFPPSELLPYPCDRRDCGSRCALHHRQPKTRF